MSDLMIMTTTKAIMATTTVTMATVLVAVVVAVVGVVAKTMTNHRVIQCKYGQVNEAK